MRSASRCPQFLSPLFHHRKPKNICPLFSMTYSLHTPLPTLPASYPVIAMASPEQIHANRLNAQRSTGPRTEEGKAASRFNALTYGIEARSLVIPGEDPTALEALALEYHQQFNPFGPLEDYLVQTVVQADWNRRRYTRVEAQIFQIRLANRDASAEMPLNAFTSAAAQQVFRRLAAEERGYFRALKELRRVQRERSANEEAEAESPAADCHPQPVAAVSFAPSPVEEPQIGFVPPNPPQEPARPSKPPVSPHRGAFRRF